MAITPDEKERRWNDLKEEVLKHGGILTIEMSKFKHILDVKKLGVLVRGEIEETLDEMKLGHIPEDIPSYQDEQVRLYCKEIADLSDVWTLGIKTDVKLRQIYNSGKHTENSQNTIEQYEIKIAEYEEIIEKIRGLISEE
jgi:hypothetical protein